MSYASFTCNCRYNLLEHRLLEYMDKKSKKVKTCIPLEQIYSITQGDLTLIRDFINRNKINQCTTFKINSTLKPFDDTRIPSTKDFMNNMVKKDLKEKYHVYPSTIKYNYPLHYHNLNEVSCSAEDVKHVNIDNIDDIDRYNMKVNREKPDFKVPFKYPLKKSYKHTQDCKRKTYGYDNPVEHYFYYTNRDMQVPEHVVLPFPRGGFNSRSLNHE